MAGDGARANALVAPENAATHFPVDSPRGVGLINVPILTREMPHDVSPGSVEVLIPVFNDWPSALRLLGELDAAMSAAGARCTVKLVDDGSIEAAPHELRSRFSSIERVDVLELHCNVGHQRAIAVGLEELVRTSPNRAVVVMDADGEDGPDDVPKMIEQHQQSLEPIVVASRMHRSEGFGFRLGYRVYRAAFRALTGKSVDFGNFCLLSAEAARRVVHMPELWNHFAATLIRSRLPIRSIATRRRKRLMGRSSMSLVALVTHGFSAITVFSDLVLTRMLIISMLTAAFATTTGLTAGALRLFTNLAIPGWATSVVGFSLLLLFQTLSLLAVMIFTNLSNRSSALLPPAQMAHTYIRARRTLCGGSGSGEG